MELEQTDADAYIDDMIAALQDGEELRSRQDAKDAVKKLQELKNEKFIITTEYMEEVCLDMREETESIRKQMEGLATQEDIEGLATQGDIEGLKNILSGMESLISHLTEEIKELKTNHSTQQEQSDYEKSKSDFQKNLIELYRGTFLKVSAIPMQPDQKHCNIGRVYIRPRMTYEKQDEDGQREETEIQSMSDIFTKAGHFKSIYVLGDAGSGKSSFCKGLVNDWCLAHSDDQKTEDEDTFAGIEEMKKFDFLFYISLRHSKDDVGIFQMLERQYEKKDLLKQLLQDKSVKSLIVLDGLDEWSPPAKTSNQFQTEGLPERDLYKDYVIITTSRPWKVETLGLTDADVEQRLDLKGFDTSSVETMIKKTVAVLNETFKKNKDSRDCKNKIINNNQIADIVHIPIMLQQLICLWFDDKLPESSRCSVYTGMLDLLFKWNVKKYPDDSLFEGMRKKSNDLSDVELPLCFSKSEECKSYKYIIHRVSKLAYETLFNNPKETSLTFDNSIFEHLEIETEIKTCCLKLGILSEETCPSFSASTSQGSIFSFIHKSVQEFLAAVYIAIKSGDHIGSSVDEENANISNRCAFLRDCFCPSSTSEDVYEMDFVNEIFNKCASLDKILEQANVFIMLCGLEPRIALSISKKIYEIVKMDERVLEYKKTIDDNVRREKLISNIQQCILNSVQEGEACQTQKLSQFYLGDIVVDRNACFGHFPTRVVREYILPDYVTSLRIKQDFDIDCLSTFRRLEAIYIYFSHDRRKKDVGDKICEAIKVNASSLKSLSVNCKHPIYETIIGLLPNMRHLVAFEIETFTVPHTDFNSLCTFLSGSCNLEQISIGVNCECKKHHEVDLSKHKKLQYLKYDKSVVGTCTDSSNLETLICTSSTNKGCEKVFDILSTSHNLTKLVLLFDRPGIFSPDSLTKKLIKLLKELQQLRELFLRAFIFTDNIFECPSELKSMEIIRLTGAKMSLTTWRKFVDSLPEMPRPVKVDTWKVCITRDGEESNSKINYWNKNRGGEETAAIKYVREQEKLFNVEYEDGQLLFRFSTKKKGREHGDL
ncbi:uncharacterized protein LOC123522912 isoform X2 [Mercenaria mercenaria]|nr:uncharacterized protein LOC123522912 isoform X2 [Mercenaria mercenaria]